MDKKTIIWENSEYYGTEYMELSFFENKIEANSTIIRIEKDVPSKINYWILLDTNWTVKQLKIELNNGNRELHLSSNGGGQWFDKAGNEILELNGAIDIDISCTPFTNSLPINRLKWDQNGPINFEMVFINVPDLTYKKVNQSYELLKDTSDKRIFYYKSGSFESIIEVDLNGQVLFYPELFRRLF
ncbi:putative glycolipid-binding domain-containing protein [Heyndrickxia sporothermodurans]